MFQPWRSLSFHMPVKPIFFPLQSLFQILQHVSFFTLSQKIPESPHHYISTGSRRKAETVLRKMADQNGIDLPINARLVQSPAVVSHMVSAMHFEQHFFCKSERWNLRFEKNENLAFGIFFCQYIFYKDGQIANRSQCEGFSLGQWE